MLNHGNSSDITLLKGVNKFYIINKPNAIKYCANKWENYKILKDFYPETHLSTEDVSLSFPIIAKPLNGHHGYGIMILKDKDDLKNLSPNRLYLLQKFLNVKHEFRFNVFDGEVYQVSHREKIEDKTEKGGYIFVYRSLGANAKIKKKFWNFVYDVINQLHKNIPLSELSSYSIDVMKDFNGNYYLSEINSAFGIGSFTLAKLYSKIHEKYQDGSLEKYRVI